jgi:hypothetical protein
MKTIRVRISKNKNKKLRLVCLGIYHMRTIEHPSIADIVTASYMPRSQKNEYSAYILAICRQIVS